MAYGFWPSPAFHARMKLTGAMQQLTDTEPARYATPLTVFQSGVNARSWAEWDALLGPIRRHLAEHGKAPQRADNGIMLDRYVAGEHMLAVASALAEPVADGADHDR